MAFQIVYFQIMYKHAKQIGWAELKWSRQLKLQRTQSYFLVFIWFTLYHCSLHICTVYCVHSLNCIHGRFFISKSDGNFVLLQRDLKIYYVRENVEIGCQNSPCYCGLHAPRRPWHVTAFMSFLRGFLPSLCGLREMNNVEIRTMCMACQQATAKWLMKSHCQAFSFYHPVAFGTIFQRTYVNIWSTCLSLCIVLLLSNRNFQYSSFLIR